MTFLKWLQPSLIFCLKVDSFFFFFSFVILLPLFCNGEYDLLLLFYNFVVEFQPELLFCFLEFDNRPTF